MRGEKRWKEGKKSSREKEMWREPERSVRCKSYLVRNGY